MDNGKIPYYFETIDRNAIIVRPKRPLYNWISSIFKGEAPVFEKEESNVYLISEMDSNEDVKRWLKKNFDQIFTNELNDWYTVEDRWPKKRTYKMFEEWFDIEINSMILDLEDGPITKE